MDFRSIITRLDQIDSKKILLEDATTIAGMLRKSMSSWWGDDDSVYMAIQSVSNQAEWDQVKRIYSATGKDVEKDLAKKFSGQKLEYIKSMLASQGIRSNVLNINPVDHLTPVDMGNDTPAPSGQTQQPLKPSVSDNPNVLAWEKQFGRPSTEIAAWLIGKYPKLTRDQVQEFLSTNPAPNDDVEALNKLVNWAKNPNAPIATTDKPPTDKPPTDKPPTDKPPVNIANGNVEEPKPPTSTDRYANDPDVKMVKLLLAKAEANSVTTSRFIPEFTIPKQTIAGVLVESFGYMLEAYKDLSVAEQKELDTLAAELEKFAKTDKTIEDLINDYKKLKGSTDIDPENEKPDETTTPWNPRVAAWQKYLIDNGFKIGSFGPKRDGIDGRVGRFTRRGLKAAGVPLSSVNTSLPDGYQEIPKPAGW